MCVQSQICYLIAGGRVLTIYHAQLFKFREILVSRYTCIQLTSHTHTHVVDALPVAEGFLDCTIASSFVVIVLYRSENGVS